MPPTSHDRLVEDVVSSGLFEGVTTRTYRWSATFTGDRFVDLLLTQSDHRLLADDERARLLDAVRRLIENDGGIVSVPPATLLIQARAA